MKLSLLLAAPVFGLYSASSPVQMLDKSNFQKTVIDSDKPWLVEFFASWCGHCKQLAPEYEKAAKALKGIGNVAAVEDQAVMQSYGVQGFPTIKWFGNPKSKPVEYNSGRDAKSFVDFVMKKMKDQAFEGLGVKASKSGGGKGGNVVDLTDKDFDTKVLQDEKSMWFVKFYAPWCGHCKSLEPTWEELGSDLKGKVKVGRVDCTQETVTANKYGVKGYPTLKFFPIGKKEGNEVAYEQGRDLGSLKNFAEGYVAQTREADQLVDQAKFDEACDKLCVIAFLPHLIDSSAEERKKQLKEYNTAIRAAGSMPANYLWSQGGDQQKIEEKLNLGFGFPAVVAIHQKKSIFITHKGAFSETALRAYIRGLSSPRHVSNLQSKLPEVKKVAAWDGEDYKEEEL